MRIHFPEIYIFTRKGIIPILTTLSNRKREDKTIQEKLALLSRFKVKSPPKCFVLAQAENKLGVKRTALQTMVSNEEELRRKLSKDSPSRERQRTGKATDV